MGNVLFIDVFHGLDHICSQFNQKYFQVLQQLNISYSFVSEMEIIPEGKHFRLVKDSELPEILTYLERYLPEALKVCI